MAVSTSASTIKVNLIVGYLGVGKTTAIRHLLQQKPAGERWAVLVNEFGEVAVDHAAFPEGEGIRLKEIAGGCLCCTANLPMRQGLAELIRRVKPDRILIEPTGLGHPAGMIDTLQDEYMAPHLDVRATIALVDPRQWAEAREKAPATYFDQLELADVLVANKTDLAPGETLAAFQAWAHGLYPPKTAIQAVNQGRLEPSWLDWAPYPERRAAAQLTDSHEHSHEHTSAAETGEGRGEPAPGRPLFFHGENYGRVSLGWRFHPEDVFERARLLHLFAAYPAVERMKGVFRVGKRWILLDQVRGELSESEIAYRRDSRLEVLGEEVPPAKEVERALRVAAGLSKASANNA